MGDQSVHCLECFKDRLKDRCSFFFFNFIYLFLAVLGLRFCARASSSCREWEPLFIAVRGPLTLHRGPLTLHRGAQASHYCGLSCCGAQAPDAQAQ